VGVEHAFVDLTCSLFVLSSGNAQIVFELAAFDAVFALVVFAIKLAARETSSGRGSGFSRLRNALLSLGSWTMGSNHAILATLDTAASSATILGLHITASLALSAAIRIIIESAAALDHQRSLALVAALSTATALVLLTTAASTIPIACGAR